ncbi:hypothetical protein SCLCIDRAFT_34727 [Scleroderma citrinum Foug A]|uniref:Uncharacterized protein n=1 Tax=Scleroderma citrinum Foug A TaxID=1036808 RepID=A0A0C2ZAC0_9AGAM|nr:hypothetical protein SCLCIDRAFT_34727 [Scleroderma citrinum Foug A]
MPEALELHFIEKSLRGGAGINIGHDDAKKGKFLFLEGVKHFSTEALEEAVLMKSWEIKEVEHYAKLMCHIHKQDYMKYKEFVADEEDVNVNTVDGLMAYNHELYNEQLVPLGNVDSQLDQLEEAMKSRVTHHSPYKSDCDSDEDVESEDDKAGDKMATQHMAHGLKGDINDDSDHLFTMYTSLFICFYIQTPAVVLDNSIW